MSAVGRNMVWLLLSQTATWLVTLVTVIALPNLLGPGEFGALSLAGVIVTYFSTLAGLESGPVMIRSIARDASTLPSLVKNAVVLRLVTVALAAVIAISLPIAMGASNTLVVLVAVGCVGMLLANLNHVVVSALAGLERMGRPAMWTTIQLAVGGVLGMSALALSGSVVVYAAILAATTVIPLAANWGLLRPYLAAPAPIDRGVIRGLVTGGLPLLALTALTQFYGNVDFPVLEWIAGRTAVDWYSLAYRWAGIPFFICTAVVAAYFPRLAGLAPRGGVPFAAAVNRALTIVVIVSLLFATALFVAAEDLVRLLYPDSYLPAVPVLRILALQVPMTAIDTVLGTALVASERVRPYLLVAAAASLLTPMALVVSIEAFADGSTRGAAGAALVTTATEVFVFVGASRLRAPGVLDRRTTSVLVRAGLAAGLVLATTLWLGDISLFVAGPLAMVLYAALTFALRVVTIDDLRDGFESIRGSMRRRGGEATVTVDGVEESELG